LPGRAGQKLIPLQSLARFGFATWNGGCETLPGPAPFLATPCFYYLWPIFFEVGK
jgi:hypothetical protein